jgi:hypothetical protein
VKQTTLYILIGLLVLALGASLVYAAAGDGSRPFCPGPNGRQVTLTDQQRQELAPLYHQMLETQQQIMQKRVEYGQLTQEQADQRALFMQERMNNWLQNGGSIGRGRHFGPGRGSMKGPGNGACYQQQQQTAQ